MKPNIKLEDVANSEVIKDFAECLFLAVSMLEGENKDKVLAKMAEKGFVDIG